MFTEDFHEECGVFGIYNNPEAARLTYLGLYALQHRGQESAGIAASDGAGLKVHKGMGLVNRVFSKSETFNNLAGKHAIGHNRYSTHGSSTIVNAQPIMINYKLGQIAGAHNGNLTNCKALRDQMEQDGSIFSSTTDTEIIMHLLARSRRDSLHEMILDALSGVKGAYSILFLSENALYAARDSRGVRPLSIAKLDQGYVLSSETCAFDLVGAELIREIEPGEMIRIDEQGITSFPIPTFEHIKNRAYCVFEYIYFSRPDSFVFGNNVDKIRRQLGRQLAKEHPVPNADIVIGVPDSATTAALGFAEESKANFEIGLIRNHYVGRTFIHPAQSDRDFGVRIKFNPVRGVIKGKKLVIVDDSIVRGTTMRKIIRLIRSAGPAEVHLRISSPPVMCPCYMGIDMPTREELIGSNKTTEEIQKYLDVDSLGYLSIDGMMESMPGNREDYCNACFSGNYPIPPENGTTSTC